MKVDFTFRIAGMAGDGIREAGMIAGKIFSRLGYYVYIHQEYQSLIRGGHNAAIIRVSERRIYSHELKSELLIALQDYIVPFHENNCERILFDSGKFTYNGNKPSISVNMTEMAKEVGVGGIFRNAVGIGALSYLYGVDLEIVNEIFRDEFGEKAGPDIELALKGYEYTSTRHFPIREVKPVGEPRPLMDGNQCLALGAVRAGLKHYYAYPMTPSSSILHFLARWQDELNLIVSQPENEIAVAVMAIGTAFAGKRVMVGTSGGGFALMQEAFSMAGMTEVPVVFVEVQRGGPSTGLPTYHAQEDLRFVIHAGHGEFPRIVVAPGDGEEAYYLAGDVLNLSWKIQTPGIILMDRQISESATTVDIEEDEVSIELPERFYGDSESYKRYTLTENGISPIAFPGEARVKGNSNEHDEMGYTTDVSETSSTMYEKRMRKQKVLIEEVKRRNPVGYYGEGDNIVFTWGSAKGPVVEAASRLEGVKIVQVRYLAPFPFWEIKDLEFGTAVTVECNFTGQLGSLLKEFCGFDVPSIGRWDGRPFTPDELHERLKEVLL